MKISSGLKQDGVEVGNTYDKYGSKNIIVKRLMKGFDDALSDFVFRAKPESVHEIGCGEGNWCIRFSKEGFDVRGSDFSTVVIDLAKENAKQFNVDSHIFSVRSIYEVEPPTDSADLVVCCEVLEHLEDPERALSKLQKIVTNKLIISVPREPIWCAMNLARGKYITTLGNTPGHIQHWSTKKIGNLVSKYFDIIEVRTPLPWTMMYCRKKP